MTANARVVTARNRPRTRNAGKPTRTATSTPNAVARITAIPHGTSMLRSNRLNGIGMSWPSVNARVASPPTPTKANWPRDSCPAHPVRTVKDRATMANNRMLLQVRIGEELVTKTGTRANAPNRKKNPMPLRLRTHQMLRSRSGIGRSVGDSDQPTSSLLERTNHRTTTNTVMKNQRLTID